VHLDASRYDLKGTRIMAVPFHWHFKLHYTSSQELLHKDFGETVCEKANTAYKRAKE
jgi:hypothetical protein